jgi:ribosome maturation factor RimP
MSRSDRETRIQEGVETLLKGSEIELVDLQFGASPRGLLVRILVDKPGGVTVEDCARVSRAVGDQLDALEAISGRYVLEVSSPGIDRPLRRREDYERFAGETAEVVTLEMIGDRREHRGTLAGFDAATGSVLLGDEGGAITAIPLGVIRRAHLRRDPWLGARGGGRKSEP